MTEQTKLRRRVKQLERCLQDVQRMAFYRGVEIYDTGRDRNGNPEWDTLCRMTARIRRTLK